MHAAGHIVLLWLPGPRHCHAWERFFPLPTVVPLDIATVKLHLSGCLTRARYASFEDAWCELKLGHWVWYTEGHIYAREFECPMAKSMDMPRRFSMPWVRKILPGPKPKAPPKAHCKTKGKAHGKCMAKPKAKAKAKAVPQATQPLAQGMAICPMPASSSTGPNS